MVESTPFQIDPKFAALTYKNSLDIGSFTQMLKDPTCCYKFYWLEALVNIIDEGCESATMDDVINEMIANAWYTVLEYHIHLSGTRNGNIIDGLEKAVLLLSSLCGLLSKVSKLEIKNAIHENDTAMQEAKETLTKYVPYRALAGFFDCTGEQPNWNKTSDIVSLVSRINEFHPMPYTFESCTKLKTRIHFHPVWCNFIRDNSVEILGWIQYEKSKWLQTHNPEIPGMIYKLSPAIDKVRKLEKVRTLWSYIVTKKDIRDIYNDMPIEQGLYDVDHFVPWSFVMNDELWNLVPMDSSLNSSKSNLLPPWKFFDKFALNQFKLYQVIQEDSQAYSLFEKCYNDNLHSIWAQQELYRPKNTQEQFFNILEKNLQPLYDSAKRQGYQVWHKE